MLCFVIFRHAREKLLVTVALDHPVAVIGGNLSGRNWSGSSHSSGSMWVAMKFAAIPVPWKINIISTKDHCNHNIWRL